MSGDIGPLADPTSLSPQVTRTQARILEAVRTTIDTFGPRRFRIEDVMAEAGVSRQTIANYFGTKDELLRTWADNEHRMMAEVALATVAEADDLIDGLEAAAALLLTFLTTRPSLQPPLRRDMVTYLASEGAAFPDVFSRTLAEGLREITGADEAAALAAGQVAYRLMFSFGTQPTDQVPLEDQARSIARSLVAVLGV